MSPQQIALALTAINQLLALLNGAVADFQAAGNPVPADITQQITDNKTANDRLHAMVQA